MKLLYLHLLATLLIAVDFVVAIPVQVEIVSFSSSIEIHGSGQMDTIGPIRHTPIAAHSKAPAGNDFAEGFKHRKGCGMHKMRLQAIKFSNWLRGNLGLPLIETPHKFKHEHLSFKPLSPFVSVPMASGIVFSAKEEVTDNQVMHQHSHGHMKPKSFLGRVRKALMTLGIWEGRIVAFVIGCGIGSVLRMLWVLFIVFFRARTTESDTTPIYLYVEEADEVEPPKYSDDTVKHDERDMKQVA